MRALLPATPAALVFVLALVLVPVFALVLAPAPAAGAAWRLPVDGAVVGRFRVGADPFAAGQRRGVDLAAAPGGRVVAPCSGRVAFAGRLPRFGRGVSVRCGRLTATVLGLAGRAPRTGALVRRGDVIGQVGAGGRVRLGARVTGSRLGYRDPLRLIGAPVGAHPPLVGPGGSSRRRPAPPPESPVRPSVSPVRPSVPLVRPSVPLVRPSAAAVAAVPAAPRSVASPLNAERGPNPQRRAPTLAWVGLALLACALPGGAIAWRVRRRPAPLAP
jgi:hypothetical protein